MDLQVRTHTLQTTISLFYRSKMSSNFRESKFPPRCKWYLRSSRKLCSVNW